MNQLIRNKYKGEVIIIAIKSYRIGEERLNNKGFKMKIIKYINVNNIDVEFENGFIRKNLSYSDFKRGALDHVDYSKRIGEERYNFYGSKIVVTDYKNSDIVHIKFDNGYASITTWGTFSKGDVRSPYCKTLYGIGFLGEGEFTSKDIWHNHWRAMVERVNVKNDNFHRTYIDVTIYEEWYNYQNFAKWAKENYYEIENLRMELDKDILFKGNKIYSPDTCVFVPQLINALFVKADKSRGDLPIGVYWHERDQEYRAQCSYITETGKRKNKWLGGHNNPEDAYLAYKKFKEYHIKEIADRYKEYIPEKLYKVLYEYRVEITD